MSDVLAYTRFTPHRQVEVKKIKDANVNEGPSVPSITAILSYSKGFACSRGPGTVFLFEQTDENGYRKTREIKVNVQALFQKRWKVKSLCAHGYACVRSL